MAGVRTKIEYMRGRSANTQVAKRMVYPSKCGRFKLEKHLCLLDGRTRWYALHKWNEKLRDFWHMIEQIKTYRTRPAAERELERFRKVLDGESIKKRKPRKPARKR